MSAIEQTNDNDISNKVQKSSSYKEKLTSNSNNNSNLTTEEIIAAREALATERRANKKMRQIERNADRDRKFE
jgi:hypothetical protein